MEATNAGATPNMIAQQMMSDLFSGYTAPAPQPQDLNVNGIATGVIPTQDPGPSVNQIATAGTPPTPAPDPEPAPANDPPAQPLSDEDKRAHAFANLRFENKQLAGKLAEAEQSYKAEQARYEEANRKAAEYEAQLEQERRARVEVEEALGRANLADSKEFKERFDSRHDEMVHKLAAVIADKTDMNDISKAENFAHRLMQASDAEVLHAIEKLPNYVQGSIYNLVREGKQISAEREEALDQWRVTQSGISEAEARRRAAELSQRRQEMADRAVQAISSNATIPSFSVTEPEFADIRKRRLEEAAAFVRTATEEDLAQAAVEGMMAPLSYAMIDQLMEENARLNQQLDAMYRTSAPPLRAHTAEAAPPPRPAPTYTPVNTLHSAARDMIGSLMRR